MNIYLYLVLIAILLLASMKNAKEVRQAKAASRYQESYTKILRNESDAYSYICDYLDEETNPGSRSATLLLKAYLDMERGLDYSKDLSAFSLSDVFYSEGKYDPSKVQMASDTFVWMILILAMLKKIDDEKEMDLFMDKFKEHLSDFETQLEYKLLDTVYQGYKGGDIRFFNELLAGDYGGYAYDKRIIGVYKHIAMAMNDLFGVGVAEDDLSELRSFSMTSLGSLLMGVMGNKDKYAENTEEEPVTEKTPEIEAPEEEDKPE